MFEPIPQKGGSIMPRSVRAFACIHGCKKRVTTHKKDMAEHEASCWHNPIHKTCFSCRHDIRDPDYGIYCELDAIMPGQKQAIRDCPQWEAKSK